MEGGVKRVGVKERERETERESMWSENEETDKKSRKRELSGDGLNYDQGTLTWPDAS